MVTLRRTWHVHFDTDAEELLAGVQVGMVAGPRCRTHSHAAIRAHMPMGLRLGLLTPRSKDCHAWSSFRVAVVAATGAVVTAWRTPARRA